jgi:AraC-like DNA-binding protein
MTTASKIIQLAVLLSAILAAALSSCAPADETKKAYLSIEGDWKIIDADSPAYALPGYDDGGAPSVRIPGGWMHILDKNDDLRATVWIRKKVFIGNEFKSRRLLLTMGRTGIADEAYFNGEKIGLTGIIPDEPASLRYRMSWQDPRRYFIPEKIIAYGAENLIAIRIFSHVLNGVKGDTALGDYASHYFSLLYNSYKSVAVNIFSISLNIMLLFVFIILFLSESGKTKYLYFSLILLFTIVCNLLTLETPISIHGLLRYKMFLFFYNLTNFFVLHGVKNFLGIKNKPVDYLSAVLLAITEFAIIAAPTTRFLIYYCGFASLVLINLFIIVPAVMFLISIKKDPRRYWYFIFLVIPITVSVMRNSWYLFSFRFNELPLTIFLHVPVVFAFITMNYIRDFGRTKKEMDMLYSTLLKKSRTYERILKTIQHENKKPDPRDVINSVIEYLDSNYYLKYDRVELSRKFGLNEDYMGQLFKKVTGMTISSYINTNKINAAKSLLTGTNSKIIDIAYHVGFENLTHFHRQFKKQTGCTPNEYRTVVKKETV